MSEATHERYGGDARITPAMEDYLKVILKLELDGIAPTTQRLADEMQLRPASVTNMVKRLAELNVVKHERYRGVELTPTGRNIALEVVRHHRLLELYLSRELGLSIEDVHDEADRLEHHLSETLERHMEQRLNFPAFDPHGHPIPSRSGEMPELRDVPLIEAPVGVPLTITRIDDQDSAAMRKTNDLGLAPGATITAVRIEPDIVLESGGQRRSISRSTANAIRVEPIP